METETKTETGKALSTIGMDKAGLLKPQTIEEAFRLATAYVKSGLLPQRFTKPETVMTAMQYALELGLKPLTALRQIAVVNGTPAVFGDLPLSLCYASGNLEWIKEWLFDKDSKPICAANGNLTAQAFGAVCQVKRKGDPEVRETAFTVEDARTANLGGPTWKSYPKYMLKYRARSQALKDKFPDALNGVAIAEYDFNTVPEGDGPVTVANFGSGAATKSMAETLNDKLKAQAATEVKCEVVETPKVVGEPNPTVGAETYHAAPADPEMFDGFQGGRA
jgi:hypothetical protein